MTHFWKPLKSFVPFLHLQSDACVIQSFHKYAQHKDSVLGVLLGT